MASSTTASTTSTVDTTATEPTANITTLQSGQRFDKITSKGRENGLFQACMKAIRQAHFASNRVRAVIVVAGLFTDRGMYTDVISIFYAITKELEEKLVELLRSQNDVICQKLLDLDYRFTEAYEKDLEFLYSSSENNMNNNWREQVEALVQSNPAALAYRNHIRNMTSGAQLAGPVFALWGGLIIGGGAVAMPRVKAKYGVEATHMFQSVTGPGREQRKADFVAAWDDLVVLVPIIDAKETPTNPELLFDTIVQSSQECMQCNNNVLSSIMRNPWWLSPLVVTSVGVGLLAVVTAAVMAWPRTNTV